MVDEIVVGFEDAVREPVVAHKLPDVFDRIELGAFWRQRNDGDICGHDEAGRQVPASLIDQEDGMGSGRDRFSDLCKVRVHRLAVAGRQDQGRALALLGADRAEDVGGSGTLVARALGRVPRFPSPDGYGSLWNGPPPPSKISLAGDSNGGADDEDCSAWHRPRQECVQCCWSGPIRCCDPSSAGPEGYADRPGRKTAELHCRHGGMLRRPSSWSPVRSSGARHTTDVTGVCPSLCQSTEERRS